MKKIVFLVFLFPLQVTAQTIPDVDYFSLGIYSGSYIGKSPLAEVNQFINSVEAEIEYRKFEDVSFYFRTLYAFTNHSYSNIEYDPHTYRLVTSFGSRYYLRNESVKPFFEASINQESNFIGDYTYSDPNNSNFYTTKGYWRYNLSLGLGVGSQFDITKKLSFQIKYDIFKNLLNSGYDFNGFSVLGGLKLRL